MLLALITFLSVRYVTGNATQGALIALIPLILGVMNVFANIGYALAALSVVLAVGWAAAPQKSRNHVAVSVYRASGLTLPTAQPPAK